MMAAVHAASSGHKVLLLEKNEKLGKKIYITGKGRCNLTNACETEDLFRHVLRNQKFLYSAFYNFTNLQAIGFFESQDRARRKGVPGIWPFFRCNTGPAAGFAAGRRGGAPSY